jgi:hypothetical protein
MQSFRHVKGIAMRNNIRTTSVVSVALAIATGSGLIFLSSSANALESSYASSVYLGGAFGYARVEEGDFDDDTDVLKAFVGAKFNDYIGAELAFNDYGKAQENGLKSDLSGVTLAAVGYLPLSDSFDLFAKVGSLWWNNDLSFLGLTRDTSGNEIYFGIGGQFNLNEQIAFRVEMERYDADLDASEIGISLDSFTVDVASVGVVFSL